MSAAAATAKSAALTATRGATCTDLHIRRTLSLYI